MGGMPITPTVPQRDSHTLDVFEQRRIASEAEVDVRSLLRALRGERVKPMTRARIERVLAARGLLHLLPERARSER